MGTRLQSALHEGIRKERRPLHGLCVIRRRRYPLLYSTVPRSLIGSPVDQAKRSTRWIVAGCQRGDQTPSPVEDGKMGGLVTELRTSSKTADFGHDAIQSSRRSPIPTSRRLPVELVLHHVSVQGSVGPKWGSPPACFSHHDICLWDGRDDNLVLVHPWLRCLLDPALPFEDDAERFTPVDEHSGDGDPDLPFTNAPPPHHIPPHFHTIAHGQTSLLEHCGISRPLRQPFGAVLLVPLSHDEYKRVAPDHPIVVRLLKGISPRYLAQKILALDIL
ncbi:hypothetical protein HD554DRAFT_215411 [Boletus coccyginus]|nr:hypothetical protein HD554DRAFT_215411 [Boletus coccyginus]